MTQKLHTQPQQQPHPAPQVFSGNAEAQAAAEALACPKIEMIYDSKHQREIVKLPEKLSDLIDVAIADIEAVEADSRYTINMGVYHESFGGHCVVCAAGSVMAKSLSEPFGSFRTPSGYDPYTQARLYACDYMRAGNISSAYSGMTRQTLPADATPSREGYTLYKSNPTAFKAWARRSAAFLRSKGF